MKRRVAIVTGTRAEFGLLDPVMRAVREHPALELRVIAAGAHFLPPAETWRDVAESYELADRVEMQQPGEAGRLADARATARGIAGFAGALERLNPGWLVVLGDRIEAFAAASAASIAGFAVAHLHGGDRAEGVADEAMRHAITKLAHLHLPATRESAARIARLGEPERFIHVIGSPAIDALSGIPPMNDADFARLGSPEFVFLMHPIGRADELEERDARAVLGALARRRVLCLSPNHDPGREGIARAITATPGVAREHHLPRAAFIALLKRLASSKGALVGNSSAGLIEAAALRLPAIDIGPRQGGRETSENVIHIDEPTAPALERAIAAARVLDLSNAKHPFGDGTAGPRAAELLARLDPADPAMRRKRCTH